VYVNAPCAVAVPKGDITTTSTDPVIAYAGDVVLIVVELTNVKVVVTPPNLTVVAPVKLTPVITTAVPPACGPVAGTIEYMKGFST
jgi:chemotaxis protein CheY-P-specific phosphatase CheC